MLLEVPSRLHVTRLCDARATLKSLKLRVSREINLRPADHILFASIGKSFGRISQRNPRRAFHLNAHLGGNFVDFARFVAKKVETDDLKNPLFASPSAHVSVLGVPELGHRDRSHAGFLEHLADGRLL